MFGGYRKSHFSSVSPFTFGLRGSLCFFLRSALGFHSSTNGQGQGTTDKIYKNVDPFIHRQYMNLPSPCKNSVYRRDTICGSLDLNKEIRFHQTWRGLETTKRIITIFNNLAKHCIKCCKVLRPTESSLPWERRSKLLVWPLEWFDLLPCGLVHQLSLRPGSWTLRFV